MLRQTEDALKQALISHLEVQDEMDKQGYSSLYTPTVEKVWLYYYNSCTSYHNI